MIAILESPPLVVVSWIVFLGTVSLFLVISSVVGKSPIKDTIANIFAATVGIAVFVSFLSGATFLSEDRANMTSEDRFPHDFYAHYEVSVLYDENYSKIEDINKALAYKGNPDNYESEDDDHSVETVIARSVGGDETIAYLVFQTSEVEGVSHTASLALSEDEDPITTPSPTQLVDFKTGESIEEQELDVSTFDIPDDDEGNVVTEQPFLTGLSAGSVLLLGSLMMRPAFSFAKKRALKTYQKIS